MMETYSTQPKYAFEAIVSTINILSLRRLPIRRFRCAESHGHLPGMASNCLHGVRIFSCAFRNLNTENAEKKPLSAQRACWRRKIFDDGRVRLISLWSLWCLCDLCVVLFGVDAESIHQVSISALRFQPPL